MSKIFIGVGHGPAGGSDVYVEQNGERRRLTRSVGRVHEGYSWDEAGPNSTALARAMLWLVNGGEPPWALYRGFTSDVIARLPVPICEGECWRLSEAEIQAWLHDVGWSTPEGVQIERGPSPAEGANPVRAEARRRAILDWKERAKLAAPLFRKRVPA